MDGVDLRRLYTTWLEGGLDDMELYTSLLDDIPDTTKDLHRIAKRQVWHRYTETYRLPKWQIWNSKIIGGEDITKL
jgi:hypothetical protein